MKDRTKTEQITIAVIKAQLLAFDGFDIVGLLSSSTGIFSVEPFSIFISLDLGKNCMFSFEE